MAICAPLEKKELRVGCKSRGALRKDFELFFSFFSSARILMSIEQKSDNCILLRDQREDSVFRNFCRRHAMNIAGPLVLVSVMVCVSIPLALFSIVLLMIAFTVKLLSEPGVICVEIDFDACILKVRSINDTSYLSQLKVYSFNDFQNVDFTDDSYGFGTKSMTILFRQEGLQKQLLTFGPFVMDDSTIRRLKVAVTLRAAMSSDDASDESVLSRDSSLTEIFKKLNVKTSIRKKDWTKSKNGNYFSSRCESTGQVFFLTWNSTKWIMESFQMDSSDWEKLSHGT